MELLLRHFWIAFIAVTCINIIIWRFRGRRYIEANPELEDGYARLTRGALLWGNAPWIVMGFGCTFGDVPSVFHYFRPRDGNPYVLAFFASVIVLWIAGFRWLFFRNGAEELIKHPGLFNWNITSPTFIKLIYTLCVFSGVIALVMMFVIDVPLAPIP